MYPGRLLPTWWLLLASATVVLRLLSEGLIDGGDSVQHYHIARASWERPELLLDHWGKPLFTLLSSPFAQLGLWGMTLFNALCFIGTCWAADGLLRAQGGAARLLFPPLLLLMPEYGRMVLAGMTEPLFALLTVLTLRGLHDGRLVGAAVVASLTPFARPEFVAFVPFVALWLSLRRAWHALPWLLLGSAAYAAAGAFAFGDALWMIHHDPYQGARAVYGSGDALHFIRQLPATLGWPALVLWFIGALAALVLWRKQPKERGTLSLLTVVAALPALAILGVHSFLWWKGLKSSLGLTRVLATAAPLVLLFGLWPTGRWLALAQHAFRAQAVGAAAGVAAVAFAASAFLRITPLPTPADGYQRFLRQASERAAGLLGNEGALIYYHPQVGLFAGMDGYSSRRARQTWGLDTSAPALGLGADDLLAWDAHFGPNEGGTPLAMLLARKDLAVQELRVPEERMNVLGGHPFEVWLFKAGQQPRTAAETMVFDLYAETASALPWRMDTLVCAAPSPGRCLQEVEFPLELLIPCFSGADALYREVRLQAVFGFDSCAEGKAELVYTENGADGRLLYWSWPMASGEQAIEFRLPPRPPGTDCKLYIWNLHRCAIRVQGLRISINEVRSDATPS